MRRLRTWILGLGAALLLVPQAGCIIGFKVDTSTSATASASESDSKGSTSVGSASTGDTDPTSTGGTSEGTSATEGTDATSDATTSDATSDATTTTTSATTETGGAGECELDSECALVSDCCTCDALPVGEAPDLCMAQCDTPRCESIGVTGATCRFGVCGPVRVACDDSQITCDSLPPSCGAGELPVVDPKGVCYTGACAPAALCDRVPSCALCPAEMMCVSTVDLGGTTHTCEPVPAACEGTPSCACAGALACVGVDAQCDDQGSELVCSCPDC